MNAKVYFNVKKVSKIEISFERLENKKFYPAELGEKRYLLGFISLGKSPDLPDRWVENGRNGKYCYNDDDYIRSNTWYKVQEEPKLLFYRPWVRVNMGYKESVHQYFDTDQEAQEFVDLIVNTSSNTFEVITS
jgi:hypothetical protein